MTMRSTGIIVAVRKLPCFIGVVPKRLRGILDKITQPNDNGGQRRGHPKPKSKETSDNVMLYAGSADVRRASSNRQISPACVSDKIQAAGGGHLFSIGAVEIIPGHQAQPRVPRCRPAERREHEVRVNHALEYRAPLIHHQEHFRQQVQYSLRHPDFPWNLWARKAVEIGPRF